MVASGTVSELSLNTELVYLVIASILGSILQTSMIMSLRYEKASTISLIESLSVVYGFLADLIFFHAPITVVSVIGGVLIVGSFIFMTSTEQKDTKETKSEPVRTFLEK
jgi:drug/metabolite transporter (DMT)-like permease